MKAFLLELAPIFVVLAVLAFALRTWRWHRQRPLHDFTGEQLRAAFRFSHDHLDYYKGRGSMSYRELHDAINATQRLIAEELRRR